MNELKNQQEFSKKTEKIISFHNGHAIMYITHKTPELYLAAVQQNGHAIKYIKNQTPELCLEAIRNQPLALKFILNHTEDLILESLKNSSEAFQYAKIQTPEICLTALQHQVGRNETMAKIKIVDKKYLLSFDECVNQLTMMIMKKEIIMNGL